MSNREKTTFTINPLHRQARDLLANRITAGIYRVGDALPSEVDLARELGVSEGTIRKALNDLKADFIVSREQGRGTFVLAKEPARECPACCGTGRIASEKAA